MLQVFTNLLTNAIKATPEHGRVSIECDPEGDVVLAHVRDSGVGIPPDMCDRIFEPFVQVSRSLNRPEDGIGLGLSISRNLARAMGGELTVESRIGTGIHVHPPPAAGRRCSRPADSHEHPRDDHRMRQLRMRQFA